MDSSPYPLLLLEAMEAWPDPFPGADGAGRTSQSCRPDSGFAAQCMAPEQQPGALQGAVKPLPPVAWPSIGRAMSRSTDPNRRVRTRTHGGVGGVGPRGLPLSRLFNG